MKCNVETVRKFGTEVFEKAGLSHKDAAVCMDSFLLSDLRGIRTHGTTHLKAYCERLEKGTASTGSEIEIVETAPSSLVVDAKHAVGMSCAMTVMERCIENARKSGACFASVKNGCHYGFGGYFPMKAAEQNMIGFCIANTPALVVPFGGAEPLLGTNPISVAVPAGEYPALVLDMATSLVAKGKISLALKEGKSIPDTWAVDKNGAPTTDPAAANVGALLPVGGPKGYALGLLVSVLASALSGSATDLEIPRFWEETDKITDIGYFMGAIDISKYCPPEVFKARADAIFRTIKQSRPAPGFQEVMIPGEIEFNLTQKSIAEGLEMSEVTLREFRELAEKYGIEYPFGA
ncbi:MAG: lactate dehydrogenase [Oscillospiraceae bacterium]|nr:MAG: lactate dehydrogenase [Oscillospiraceae bacterium]